MMMKEAKVVLRWTRHEITYPNPHIGKRVLYNCALFSGFTLSIESIDADERRGFILRHPAGRKVMAIEDAKRAALRRGLRQARHFAAAYSTAAKIINDNLRAAAPQAGGRPVPHVCGARGFGYSSDDLCPACEDARKGSMK